MLTKTTSPTAAPNLLVIVATHRARERRELSRVMGAIRRAEDEARFAASRGIGALPDLERLRRT